ncbi:MAG TPA: class I SAM-dependent methyltransferase [Actinomycetota bacterium]
MGGTWPVTARPGAPGAFPSRSCTSLSEGQLAHARRLLAQAGVHVPLVQASAEAVPLADASFDIVFCDHGAMNDEDRAWARRWPAECIWRVRRT